MQGVHTDAFPEYLQIRRELEVLSADRGVACPIVGYENLEVHVRIDRIYRSLQVLRAEAR